ncbi:MAG: hypothetical protein H6684_08360 [Deltaproteobacteria bacterium]|nr:hypothetical protein [Deltaproteobacteria bacterium]MCB9479285.1 hypothetical protein [Deltaproteobacteria bacterium]MCB9488729.1 hypothetical protein [Deltaproteobacteria bacterium]
MSQSASHLFGDSLKLTAANVFFAVSTLAVGALAARLVGPAHYGDWGAVWALMVVTSAVFPSVVMIVARQVSGHGAHGDGASIRRALRTSAVAVVACAVIGSALWIAAAAPLSRWLSIGEPGLMTIVALFFGASLILSHARGALEGYGDFSGLSRNVAAEGAIRLVLGAAVLAIGWGLTGLSGAYLAAAFVALAWGIAQTRADRIASPASTAPTVTDDDLIAVAVPPDSPALPPGFIGPVLATHALVVLLTNVDMILVKRVFADADAGLFTVGFTGGKLLFFLSEGLASAMFPKAVALVAKGGDTRPLLYRMMALYAGGAGLSLIAAIVAPLFLVTVFFGEEYAAAAPLLAPYTIFAASICAAILLAKYQLALSRYAFLAPLSIGAIVLAGALLLYHPSLRIVTWMLATGGVAIAAATANVALRLPRAGRQAPEKTTA